METALPDGSVMPLQVAIASATYSDPNGIYDWPDILKSRTGSDALGFDYFYMKSAIAFDAMSIQ